MPPLELPEEVLGWICQAALEAGVPATTLATINSHWHTACHAILYEHLAIPDNYQSLLQPSGLNGSTPSAMSRAIRKLQSVLRSTKYANNVKAVYFISVDVLNVTSPDVNDKRADDASDSLADSPDDSDLKSQLEDHSSYMDESQLLRLMKSHLTSIQSFTWALIWAPSHYFVTQLHQACARISSVDILRPPKTCHASSGAGPSSPRRALGSQAPLSSAATHLRWDGHCLAGFRIGTLANLTLQNLSMEGVKTLASLCSGLVACQVLEIWDTLFVDDSLLSSIAEGLSKLRTFRLKRMPGTKVTNKGLAAIMESSLTLEELELREFEGRLTKKCWDEIGSYPATLRRIQIVYAEDCVHSHSWTTDHLASVATLVDKMQALESFHIGRLVRPYDGDHLDQSHLPIAMQPKPLPEGFLANLMKHKETLRSIQLDFWELSYDRLRTIFEVLPNLLALQVLLDAPFAKLLGASSSHLSLCKLKKLSVSITERYQTIVAEKSGIASRARATSVVEGTMSRKIAHRARQTSVGVMVLGVALAAEESLPPPPTKDVKKLAKRFPYLSVLHWGGRNGAGVWRFTRASNGKDLSIHFSAPSSETDALPAMDGLFRIHVPDLGPVLADVGATLKNTKAIEDPLPECFMVTSVTSSSLATSLSNSSTDSSTCYSGNTTVPSSPELPKQRLSPTSRAERERTMSAVIAPTSASKTLRLPDFRVSPWNLTGSMAVPTETSAAPKNVRTTQAQSSQTTAPAGIKKVHRDGWVTRKPASSTNTVPTRSNKPPQPRRPAAVAAKPAALTEENLKQLKKSTQGSRNAASAEEVTAGVGASGTAKTEKAKQPTDAVDGGFALVNRSRRPGRKT